MRSVAEPGCACSKELMEAYIANAAESYGNFKVCPIFIKDVVAVHVAELCYCDGIV